MGRRWPTNDWLAYFSEQTWFDGQVNGRELYIPSPTDIPLRIIDLRFLKACLFPRRFIVNVMELDNPTIERVRQMVGRHGVVETYRRCLPFLEPTEYDDDYDHLIGRIQTTQSQGRRVS